MRYPEIANDHGADSTLRSTTTRVNPMRKKPNILLGAAALLLSACSITGPTSIATGRNVYNAIINATEDEQFLSMMIRQRYDETFGMLAVSSVTSSISSSTSIASDIGIGPKSNYTGHLIPLSLGIAYEERPTISYVPITGEAFIQRALEPIRLKDLYLLTRATHHCPKLVAFLVARINGFGNFVTGVRSATDEFRAAMLAFEHLNQIGAAELISTGPGDDVSIAFLDYDEHATVVDSFLEALLIDPPADPGNSFLIPIRAGVDRQPGYVTLETRSVVDIIRTAGEFVSIPEEHIRDGIVTASSVASEAPGQFMRIQSSSEQPEYAVVSTYHRGYWFYIDARDTESKRSFALLRTLFGIRFAHSQTHGQSPSLTIPIY